MFKKRYNSSCLVRARQAELRPKITSRDVMYRSVVSNPRSSSVKETQLVFLGIRQRSTVMRLGGGGLRNSSVRHGWRDFAAIEKFLIVNHKTYTIKLNVTQNIFTDLTETSKPMSQSANSVGNMFLNISHSFSSKCLGKFHNLGSSQLFSPLWFFL